MLVAVALKEGDGHLIGRDPLVVIERFGQATELLVQQPPARQIATSRDLAGLLPQNNELLPH